jgi:hypothetical protein
VKKIFFVCLIFFFSCSASLPEKTELPFSITKAGSLLSIQPSAYEVAYYLVGRIKKVKMESGMPVEIKILKMRDELLGAEIAFKIVDTTHFEIFYTKNNKRIKSVGVFSDDCKQSDIEMQVFKTEKFENINSSDFFSFNYMFSVSRK